MTEEKKDSFDWKTKFGEALNVVQTELNRTKDICKKMIDASNSNSVMNESYEALGQIIYAQVKSGEYKSENEEITALVGKIDECKDALEQYESDLKSIKK